MLQRFRPQRIKLQVNLNPRLEPRQRFHKFRILRNPDAIRIEHEVANGPAFGRGYDLQNLWVNGGLATRKLQQVRLAFAGHQRIHHAFNLGQRPVGGFCR